MRQSISSMRRVVMMAVVGTVMTVSFPLQTYAQEHQYSAQLVERYNSGCSEQLRQKGYSDTQAQTLCACSLKQMQSQHDQSSAIFILTSAQLNPVKDPNLGLPSTLYKYFTPCFG